MSVRKVGGGVKKVGTKKASVERKDTAPSEDQGSKSAREKYPTIFSSVGLLGFEVVEHSEDRGLVRFLCRTKLSSDLLFARIQMLLLSVPDVGIGKQYMIKGGQLVYGWYLAVPTKSPLFVSKVQEIAEKFPIPVTGTKLYGGNPTGKLAESGKLPPGSGAGVIPGVSLAKAVF